MSETAQMETPTPGVSIAEYVAVLRRDGVVVVPCPHGSGEYIINVNDLVGYGTPSLVYAALDKKGEYGLNAAPAYLRTNYGRHILWYPRGLGYRLLQDASGRAGDREHMIALAKMLIGMIVSGRKLYAMHCGQNINSWNTNETVDYDYYY